MSWQRQLLRALAVVAYIEASHARVQHVRLRATFAAYLESMLIYDSYVTFLPGVVVKECI